MKDQQGGILSGIIAGAVFLIFIWIIGAGLILSLCVGAASFCLFAFLIFRTKKAQIIITEGVTQDDLFEILAEGERKVKLLESANIEDVRVKTKVRQIALLAESIFDDIKKDPKSVKSARKFLTYYMDTTIYIVQRYEEMTKSALYSQQARDMLPKIDTTLDNIQRIFEKLKDKLLEDDLFDLDIEIELLEKTMKSEGI